MQNHKPNLMGSIANLARNVVGIVETRLTLFALDLQETGMNLLSLLILCGIILTCAGLFLILVTLLVVVIFWDTHRLLALGAAAGFFALAGLGLWFIVLAKLRSEIRKAQALPEIREKLGAGGGLESFVTTPEEFAALIRRDYERFGKLIKDVGIKAD